MIPKTISASAAHVFDLCPARYKAEWVDRIPDLSTSAADLGTVCHAALDVYVSKEYYKHPDVAVLKNLFVEAYDLVFSDRGRLREGWDMLQNWFERTDLNDGRKILSTEQKSTFSLPTSAGPIPFTYIFDRCDQRPDGSIEVIDYKSVSQPIQPEDLKKRIQPRVYGLAASIAYKHLAPPAVWVTYDLLRYDTVGAKFTREDNIETWRWLLGLAERILADDGLTEKLNPECRWCVRKAVCKTLIKHATGGGALSIDTLDDAADARASLDYARSAIVAQISDLDEFILVEMEERDDTEYKTSKTRLNIRVSGRREIDSERANKVLPPELVAKYCKLPISAIDEILKNGTLDTETKAALKSMIRKKPTKPSVVTSPVTSLDEVEK
jgi:RecB family exonuclease